MTCAKGTRLLHRTSSQCCAFEGDFLCGGVAFEEVFSVAVLPS